LIGGGGLVIEPHLHGKLSEVKHPLNSVLGTTDPFVMYSTSHFHTNMDANMDMIPATGIDWFAVRCTRIQQRKFIQDQRSELLAKSN